MRAAILDTNAILALCWGGCFEVVRVLFDLVFIPSTVRAEVLDPIPQQVLRSTSGEWLRELVVAPDMTVDCPASLKSAADRDLFLLMRQTAGAVLVTGDRKLQAAVAAAGGRWAKPVDVIVLMKRRGLVQSVRAVLRQMMERGYGISPEEWSEALRDAGELS